MDQRNRKGNQTFLRNNENENTYQNLWNATKAVYRVKLIASNTYIRKGKQVIIKTLNKL